METVGSLAEQFNVAFLAEKLGGQTPEMHSAGDASSGAQFATDGQKEFGRAGQRHLGLGPDRISISK